MGVAMLAKAAFEKQNVSDIVMKWVRPISKVKPRLQDHYNTKFNLYKKLYPALKKLQ
jgi:hypothetical protein